MSDVLKCSSCRKNDIETVFKFDPNNKKHSICSVTGNRYQTNKIYKTCKECRERKTISRNLKKINDTFIVKPKSVDALIISSDEVEDNEAEDDNSFIVTRENRNIVIHKISDYLPKGETFKIDKSYDDNEFSIVIPSRKAILSICVGDTWKHIKKYINKPRVAYDKCFICLILQKVNLITCPRCCSDICVQCYITIFRENKGKLICPFCRNTKGCELPPHLIDLAVFNMLQSVSKTNELILNK